MIEKELSAAIKELIRQVVREVLAEQQNNNFNILPEVMDVKEAANFIKMSVSWLRQNKDKVPCYSEGSRKLYRTKDLQKYIADKETQKTYTSKIIMKPCKARKIN